MKNVFRFVVLYAFISFLIFSLAACKTNGTSDTRVAREGSSQGSEISTSNPRGGGGGTNLAGSGWVGNDVLSRFGLNGMRQPDDMKNILWTDYTETYYSGYDYPIIYINFEGSAKTDIAIRNWFSSNGWQASEDSTHEESPFFSMFIYSKGNYEALYMFENGKGFLMSGRSKWSTR